MKLVCLFLVAAAGSSFAAPLKIELPAESAQLKSAPGFELVAGQCIICHSVEYISTQPPLPRTYWLTTVTKMQQKFGAPIDPKNIDAIVDYLVANYGAPTAAR